MERMARLVFAAVVTVIGAEAGCGSSGSASGDGSTAPFPGCADPMASQVVCEQCIVTNCAALASDLASICASFFHCEQSCDCANAACGGLACVGSAACAELLESSTASVCAPCVGTCLTPLSAIFVYGQKFASASGG
jgi:hypothetical protein